MTHSNLLKGLIDQPDSDETRMVYADWLMDRGDPRGEFIAIQCELPNLADEDPRLPELERRQNELLYKHAHRWRLSLEQRQRFEGGFVQAIACPRPQASTTAMTGTTWSPMITPRERERQLRYRIPNRLDRVCEESPVSSIANWIPTLQGSHVGRIRELIYTGRVHPERGLKQDFLESDWPDNLRSLSMSRVSLEDLRPAIEAQKFNRLSKLSLGHNLIGYQYDQNLADRFLEQLPEDTSLQFSMGWGNFSRVGQWLNQIGSRELRLTVPSSNWSEEMSEMGLDVPAETIRLVGLCVSGLHENSPNSAGAMLNQAWGQHVKTFTLSGEFRWSVRSPFSSLRGCQAVETIERLNFLTHLDAVRYPMEDWGAAIGDFHWKSLRRLKIRATNGHWQTGRKNPVVRLLEKPPEYLRRLDLSYCHLTDSDLASLLSCPGIKQITHLSLRKNLLTNKSIDLIRELGPWPDLVAIDLSRNSWVRDPGLREAFGTRLWSVDSPDEYV
jgi:uncharacterized protein (TIGR02996 family)